MRRLHSVAVSQEGERCFATIGDLEDSKLVIRCGYPLARNLLTEAGGPMSENKGRPAKPQVDERKERATNTDPAARPTTHALEWATWT